MKKVTIESQGLRHHGATAKSGSTTWYTLGGEVWTTEAVSRSGRGGAKHVASDPSAVSAPMPGKIVKIAVAQGAKVESGTTLIVLEAMKMEYTLKAATAGIVSDIFCVVGEQVPLGMLVMRLKI